MVAVVRATARGASGRHGLGARRRGARSGHGTVRARPVQAVRHISVGPKLSRRENCPETCRPAAALELLRPRQDGHRQGVHRGVREDLLSGGLDLEVHYLASSGLAARLPAPRCERAEAREGARVVLELTKAGTRKRSRRLVREALDDIVEPIIYAEALDLIERHQAEGRLVYLVSGVTRGDSPPALRIPGCPRGDRKHGGRGRRRPLHRRDGLLRVRSVQGRRHADGGRTGGDRSRGVLRLFRLL